MNYPCFLTSYFSIRSMAILIFCFLLSISSFLPIYNAMASPEDLDSSELSEIVSINFDGDEVVVIVNVQIGIKKVTLEGRPRLGIGNWTPRHGHPCFGRAFRRSRACCELRRPACSLLP